MCHKYFDIRLTPFHFKKLQIVNQYFLVVGISESSNSRVSNQNPRSRLESLGESLDSRNFQNLVLEI